MRIASMLSVMIVIGLAAFGLTRRDGDVSADAAPASAVESACGPAKFDRYDASVEVSGLKKSDTARCASPTSARRLASTSR